MSRLQPYLRELRPTLALALPIIVGQVSQMLMGVTDSVMIGHAGTVPLAASSFGNQVFNLFYVFGIGVMLPVSVFVSRARGAKSPADAAEYLRHGMALGVVRNDLPEARRELNSLTPGDRAAAQAWIEKAGERDAAVAASRKFATDAMAALAKPAP